jgi:hypothetical protein
VLAVQDKSTECVAGFVEEDAVTAEGDTPHPVSNLPKINNKTPVEAALNLKILRSTIKVLRITRIVVNNTGFSSFFAI